MARMLDLSPAKSIADISLLSRESQEWNIDDFVSKHSSGVDFVPACLKAGQAHYIDSKIIRRVLSDLEKQI